MNNKTCGGLPKSAAVLVFWLAVWQIASMAIGYELLLPSPLEVLLRLTELVQKADFWYAVLHTAVRIFGGFFMAVFAALLLAVLSGVFRIVRTLVYPFMAAVKSVPVASFVILALIWLGSDSLSVFIAFVMVLPVMYTGILAGMDARDEKMLEMAEVFGLSPIAKALYIYLPNAFSYARAALCVSLGLCWKAGVAAELIGVPHGSVGEQLYFSKAYFLTADLFAWTFVIVVLSILFEKLVLLFADKAFTLFKRM